MTELDLYGDKHIKFPCIEVIQPIGIFYLASIPADFLMEITYVDIRDIADRDLDKYLGIQRKVDPSRKKELEQYVNTIDACFPTAIILAIPKECARYDSTQKEMNLYPFGENTYQKIAKILDGQHRIAGLSGYKGNLHEFQLNVSIFIDADIEEQANIFSTVNLAQTKVNKSLVYDLYELSSSRSPQKLCHNIAVSLNSIPSSPFFHKIKRLGCATPGRMEETITQATFVKALMVYMTKDPVGDRDQYKRKKKLQESSREESHKLIFRNMMIAEQDMQITDVIFNYFSAVKKRWPESWNYSGVGNILNKTNGFRALMRFLRVAYLYLTTPGGVPTIEQFTTILNKIEIHDFSVETYVSGSSGESKLYRELLEKSGIPTTMREEEE
ncbi:DGQHR domain-containing protein [Victivallis vadensis]|uniref:DGQHR domain-containing protein n=1 Tax=Victivallis vadensis TaxID=172901 RepID=UPI0023F3A5C1|nr:DGQHR domain-containing protein [Victivallis vadensis]